MIATAQVGAESRRVRASALVQTDIRTVLDKRFLGRQLSRRALLLQSARLLRLFLFATCCSLHGNAITCLQSTFVAHFLHVGSDMKGGHTRKYSRSKKSPRPRESESPAFA
eukprot:6209154-Pleurochrysis_carterae.AAC.5